MQQVQAQKANHITNHCACAGDGRNSVHGLPPESIRQLCLSIVASELDYAAAVWFQPQNTATR